jgi:hypothetical protein
MSWIRYILTNGYLKEKQHFSNWLIMAVYNNWKAFSVHLFDSEYSDNHWIANNNLLVI